MDSDLYLDDSKLTSVDKSKFNNKQIKHIFLQNNSLKTLPEPDNQLDIITLDISHNEFENLPAKFIKKTNVQHLHATKNKLKRLDGIENATNLRDINIEDNELEEYPEGLSELKFVDRIYIGKNKIRKLGAKNVNLSAGLFDAIGGEITRADKFANYVESLNLSDNNISDLEDISLPKVAMFRVMANPLTYINLSKEDFAIFIGTAHNFNGHKFPRPYQASLESCKNIIEHNQMSAPSKYDQCKNGDFCQKPFVQWRNELLNNYFKPNGKWRLAHPDASDVDVLREKTKMQKEFDFFRTRLEQEDGRLSATGMETYIDLFREKYRDFVFSQPECNQAFEMNKINPKIKAIELTESLKNPDLSTEQIESIQRVAKLLMVDETTRVGLERMYEDNMNNQDFINKMFPILDYARETFGYKIKIKDFDLLI